MLFILVAVLAFVAVAGVGFVLVGGDGSQAKATKRAQAFTVGKVEKAKNRGVEQVNARRKQIVSTLKAQEKQARKQKLTLESRIKQSGLSITVARFWMFCGVAAGVTALVCLFLHFNPLVMIGLVFAMGLGFPRWVLSSLAKRRVKKFTGDFPNAIDIIVRGIKSGLPVNDCLRVIGRESPEPLGAEFRRLVESTSMGMSIDEGLTKMLERMPTAEVRFFSIVLSIQQKTGGNLAEALNNLSTVLRARKLMGEKIKAMSGEAIASASIIGSLPIVVMLLVSLVSPTYMAPMFTDKRGNMLLLIGIMTMASGVLVMRKMINFKF